MQVDEYLTTATPPPRVLSRLIEWNRRTAIAVGFWLVAAALIGIAVANYGRQGFVTPVVTVALFVLPGDLLRRAARFDWPRSAPGVAAADVVLSMGILVVIGSPLLAAGRFVPALVGLAVVGGGLVMAHVAVARAAAMAGARHQSITTTAIVIGAALCITALGLLAMEARPFVADRVSLGQFETVVAVAQQGAVPDSAVAFGGVTDFPVHYLFFDLALGSVLTLGGLDTYQETLQLHASLRVISVAVFGLGFFLAGLAFLRTSLGRFARASAAAALPVLLVLNDVVVAKFREPLTEGWALALTGIGIWAVITATDGARRDRRAALTVGAVALGLLVGVSLPALAAAAIFVGSWVVIATEVRWRRRVMRDTGLLVSSGWPVALGPIAGLALFNWIGRGSIADLLGGSVESAANFPGQAFQALQFMAARPLDDATPQEVLADNATAATLFTTEAGWIVLVALGLAAVIGIATMRRRPWRQLAWLIACLVLTLAYVGAGVGLGTDDVTPWNTVVRNAFYAWVPVSFFMLLGAAFATGWVKRWLATRRGGRSRRAWITGALGAVLLATAVASWVPTGAEMADTAADSGWIRRGQMTADGQAALRWIARNLPQDARIISSEVTYGSQMIAERTLVTDGKGTLEDAQVTAATIAVLSSASDFFLPARDPRVLVDYDIDYVLARSDGAYRSGQFAGVPMLRSLVRQVHEAEPPRLIQAPYLRRAERFGPIVLYEVNSPRIPEIQDDGFVDDRADLPPCEQELCLAYVPAPAEGCAIEELSSVRGRCIVTRHGATATP